MQSDIHPQYFPKAIFKCACGKTWTGGATMPEISVEICSNCHPFYTGKSKHIDTRGRIEKFTKRMEKGQAIAHAKSPKRARKPRAAAK